MSAELEILRSSRIIAVVGLSSNPMRPSHDVASYMQRAGYRIVPVNPNETEVLGEKSYPRLENIPFPVDCVNVFRRLVHIPEIVESAIRIGAKSVWLQLGLAHTEAARHASEAGLLVVENRCILVEHRRLRAALNQA